MKNWDERGNFSQEKFSMAVSLEILMKFQDHKEIWDP